MRRADFAPNGRFSAIQRLNRKRTAGNRRWSPPANLGIARKAGRGSCILKSEKRRGLRIPNMAASPMDEAGHGRSGNGLSGRSCASYEDDHVAYHRCEILDGLRVVWVSPGPKRPGNFRAPALRFRHAGDRGCVRCLRLVRGGFATWTRCRRGVRADWGARPGRERWQGAPAVRASKGSAQVETRRRPFVRASLASGIHPPRRAFAFRLLARFDVRPARNDASSIAPSFFRNAAVRYPCGRPSGRQPDGRNRVRLGGMSGRYSSEPRGAHDRRKTERLSGSDAGVDGAEPCAFRVASCGGAQQVAHGKRCLSAPMLAAERRGFRFAALSPQLHHRAADVASQGDRPCRWSARGGRDPIRSVCGGGHAVLVSRENSDRGLPWRSAS